MAHSLSPFVAFQSAPATQGREMQRAAILARMSSVFQSAPAPKGGRLVPVRLPAHPGFNPLPPWKARDTRGEIAAVSDGGIVGLRLQDGHSCRRIHGDLNLVVQILPRHVHSRLSDYPDTLEEFMCRGVSEG